MASHPLLLHRTIVAWLPVQGGVREGVYKNFPACHQGDPDC
jgi:hypothetical protein